MLIEKMKIVSKPSDSGIRQVMSSFRLRSSGSNNKKHTYQLPVNSWWSMWFFFFSSLAAEKLFWSMLNSILESTETEIQFNDSYQFDGIYVDRFVINSHSCYVDKMLHRQMKSEWEKPNIDYKWAIEINAQQQWRTACCSVWWESRVK